MTTLTDVLKYAPMYRHNFTIIVASALLFALRPTGSAETSQQWKQHSTQQAIEQGSGEVKGTSATELQAIDGRIHMVEERSSSSKPPIRFEIEFDSATLRPYSWVRTSGSGDSALRTELEFSDTQVESKVFRSGKVIREFSIPMPKPPVFVAPLLRFQLALGLGSNHVSGIIRNIRVTEDGALAVDEIKVEDLGPTEITVAAGTFMCRRFRLSPQSWMLSTLVPPGEMFIGEDDGHPLVRAVISPTRLSAPVVTEMTSYSNEPLASELESTYDAK